MIEKTNNKLCNLKSVAFKITYQCNLNCVMCGQAKFYKKNAENIDANYLELNHLKSVIDQVEKYTPQIYIWGGEPFMYPHINPFLKYIRSKKLNTFITTNGVLLDEYIEPIVDLKVAEITVSLDGHEELHEKIRGKKGIYKTILSNLRKIKEFKKKTKKVLPIVDIHIVVVKENYKTLYDFVSMLNVEGLCRRVRIQLPMFFTKDMSEEFKNYVKHTFNNNDGKSWYYFIDDYSEIDLEILNENLDRIKNKFKNIIFFPSGIQAAAWFLEPTVPLKDKCLTPSDRINIEPNGDIIACPNFPETVYGNILNESLNTIFNNEIITKHRANVSENLSGICPRCSYLYLY